MSFDGVLVVLTGGQLEGPGLGSGVSGLGFSF